VVGETVQWRDDLGAWFVLGTTAERRLTALLSREWTCFLAHADEGWRDVFAFENFRSATMSAVHVRNSHRGARE
jgi:hypothetical protein